MFAAFNALCRASSTTRKFPGVSDKWTGSDIAAVLNVLESRQRECARTHAPRNVLSGPSFHYSTPFTRSLMGGMGWQSHLHALIPKTPSLRVLVTEDACVPFDKESRQLIKGVRDASKRTAWFEYIMPMRRLFSGG
jgi:hypothetical protein